MRLDKPRPSTQLSSTEFSDRFLSEWHSTSQRFFKVERRQEYEEPDDPSYQAFERGDFAEAHALVAKRIRDQDSFYAPARAKGIELVRIRIVEFPLSSYLKDYELLSYPVSEELGERIFVTEADSIRGILDDLAVPDFLLFDERCVLVNTHDANGSPNGGLLVTDPDAVAQYATVAVELQRPAISLATFLADQGISPESP